MEKIIVENLYKIFGDHPDKAMELLRQGNNKEDIQDKNVEQQLKQVCATVYDQREEANGYKVTYLLDGIEREIHMDYDPGRRIPLENGELVIENNS